MYKLPYFTEEDPEKVLAFMKEYSFAVVTGNGNEYPVASHLPLNIEIREAGKIFLTGHLMKNTDHHKAFEQHEHVLVIFNGPHTYISASWYATPAVASTWNYITVHAKGKIKFTDEAGTLEAIRSITNKYEGNGSAASFDKLPHEYVAKLINAIVGFEIEVTELNNVFKLSQNHDKENRLSIISHLLNREDEQSNAIAQEMKKTDGNQ
jgi:transcriptional regulator